jgi:hypothetical protein
MFAFPAPASPRVLACVSARRVRHRQSGGLFFHPHFFPTLLLVGSVLATSRQTEAYLREIIYALGKILPAGSRHGLAYLRGTSQRSVGVLVTLPCSRCGPGPAS